MVENFIILIKFGFFSDVNSIVISERKLRFQFLCGNPPKNFGQNDITLIHSTYTENGIKDADSRCASAACLPRSRTDANSHSVMPHLCVLNVRLSGNEHYYL